MSFTNAQENTPLINQFVNNKARCIIRFILAFLLINSIAHRIEFSWNNDVHPLLFFTIQSNLMLALYWLLSPFIKKLQNPIIYLAVTTYMFVTGFIFVFFLDVDFTQIIYSKLLNKEISDIVHYYSMTSSMMTHYIMPLLVVIDFLFFTAVKKSNRQYYILIFPFVYFIVSMIIGVFTNKYPYPFLDASYMGGYHMIFAVVVILTLLIIGIIKLLVHLNIRIQNKMNSRIENVIHSYNESHKLLS